MPSTSKRSRADQPADESPTGATLDDPRRADIFVRNYDVERTYRLQLRVRSEDGVTYEERYRLLPGQIVAEFGVLPTGDCRVAVSILGAGAGRDRCELTRADGDTVAVEVGNGLVAVGERGY
jgi:hypothetical protein